jgi:hypothetical protein
LTRRFDNSVPALGRLQAIHGSPSEVSLPGCDRVALHLGKRLVARHGRDLVSCAAGLRQSPRGSLAQSVRAQSGRQPSLTRPRCEVVVEAVRGERCASLRYQEGQAIRLARISSASSRCSGSSRRAFVFTWRTSIASPFRCWRPIRTTSLRRWPV